MEAAVKEFLARQRGQDRTLEEALLGAYISAAFGYNSRRPDRVKRRIQKPSIPAYPFPEETSVGMVDRLRLCVLRRLAEIREQEGPPKSERERDCRFDSVIRSTLKEQPWRGKKTLVRFALIEDLQRQARQQQGWIEKTPLVAGAPLTDVPPEINPVPF